MKPVRLSVTNRFVCGIENMILNRNTNLNMCRCFVRNTCIRIGYPSKQTITLFLFSQD